MLGYYTFIIWLLILLACCLFLTGLLLMLLLISKPRTYYRRIGVSPPRENSGLSRLLMTLLSIIGIILLLGLFIFVVCALLRYLSGINILSSGGYNSSINKTEVLTNKTADSSILDTLKSGASNYWTYALAGIIVLIIILLFLRRGEDSVPE